MSQDGHVLGREGAHNHDKPRTITSPVIRRGNSMTKTNFWSHLERRNKTFHRSTENDD
jgi:hypothetical protein